MYRFHTSILFTNRQVCHEASNIFYMENPFVRVNFVTPGPFQPGAFEPFGDSGYAMPVCSDSSEVLACTRHVMEIDLIPDSVVWSAAESPPHYRLRQSSAVLQISVILFINKG